MCAPTAVALIDSELLFCPAGFTLKKRDFFRNFGTISLFAIVGALLLCLPLNQCLSSLPPMQPLLYLQDPLIISFDLELDRQSPARHEVCKLTGFAPLCRHIHIYHTVRAGHILLSADRGCQEKPPWSSAFGGVLTVWSVTALPRSQRRWCQHRGLPTLCNCCQLAESVDGVRGLLRRGPDKCDRPCGDPQRVF